MAARDFMPWQSISGGPATASARLTASASFREGELVAVADAGTLSEVVQDDSQIIIADLDSGLLGGVAAMDGDTTRTDGFARNAATASVPGDIITYWPWNQGTLFITKNFVGAGTPDTAAIPAITDVGESYQVAGINLNGTWAIEQTAGVEGVDLQAIIHQVLNVRKEPIQVGDTTTGVYLVFELRVGVGAA
jgi:hypothetical protein